MTRTGTTVTADKRKGMVRLFKGADQILHFAWKERSKSELELDLMLFPGDAEVFMLPRPPATGRCFAMRFKSSNGIHFFWLQDPKEDKDEQLMKDMNKHLGNAEASTSEPAPAPAPTGSSEAAAPEADDDDELAAALAMSMEGMSTPAASDAAPTPSAPPKAPADEAVDPGDDEEAAALEAALAMSMEAAGDDAPGGSDKKQDGDDDLDSDLCD
jgi:Na+-transporting methylmalonyl-CoA/oxaloacetate decarboxylase gamma subunit